MNLSLINEKNIEHSNVQYNGPLIKRIKGLIRIDADISTIIEITQQVIQAEKNRKA